MASFTADDRSLAAAPLARPSLYRIMWIAVVVVATFTAYCIGHTLIVGGVVDPMLSVSWAAAAVAPWGACWPLLQRAARRTHADHIQRFRAFAVPLGAAALERIDALAFGVVHGSTFAELLFRKLPVAAGVVLAAQLYARWRPAVEEERPRQAPSAGGPPLEVATRTGPIELRPCDIDWVKAAGNYLELHAAGRSHLVRRTLKGFAAETGAEHFVRIHRSVLVHRDRVAGLEQRPRAQLTVRMQDGRALAVGRSFRADVQRLLGR